MWLWLLLSLQSAAAACPRGFYGANCDLEGCTPGTNEDNYLLLAGGHVRVAQCDTSIFQSSFTISMWARPSANFSGPAGLFGHGDRSAEGGLGLGYNSNRGVVFGWGATSISVVSATIFEWHLYVGTYDSSTQTLTLYLDGLVGSPRASQTQVSRYKNVDAVMRIGSWLKSGNTEAFWGAVDEVRLFQQALTNAQVTSLQTNVPFPTTQLVLYLSMITAEDLSPARQLVTLSGAASISVPSNSSASLCFPPSLCNPNPCMGEGSVCSPLTAATFQCVCGPGRGGPTCQTTFDVATMCPPSQFLYGRGSFDSASRIEVELCNKPLLLPFSISLWVRLGQDGAVFSYGLGAATLTFQAPAIEFQWNGVTVRGCVSATSSWSNYVITVTTDLVSLYQSGTLISSRASTPAINTTIPVLVLGGGFQGWMSQVRIYRRIVTVTEVRALAGQVTFTDQLYQPDLFLPFLPQARFLDYSASPSAVRNYNVSVDTQSPTFCRSRAMDVCDPHPCNFGACVRVGTTSFTCNCFDRYMGSYCNVTNPRMCSGSRQAVDGYGQFGSNSSLTVLGCGLGLENASFTVSAWVYRALTLDEAPVISSSGGFFFGFRNSPSAPLAYFEFGFGSTFIRVYCTGWAGWKHFTGAFTWKPESQSGLLELFVDGKKVIDVMGEKATGTAFVGGSDLRVGASAGGWLTGYLSDVRVFNRRLSNSDIMKVFDNGAVFDGLQVHLPFSTDAEGLGDMSPFGRGEATVQRALTSNSLRAVTVSGNVQLTLQAPPVCMNTSPCFPNPCAHGACVVSGSSFQCLCSPSYSGPRCSVYTNRTTTCLTGVPSVHGVFSSSLMQIKRCQDEFVLNSFTFSGWYFAHSLGGSPSVVIGTSTLEPRFGLANNVMQFGWNSSLLQYPECKTFEWVHFAGVYDPGVASLKLWINGELVAQGPSGNPPATDPSTGFLWVGYGFNGRLSNIRYHSRALEYPEIVSLFTMNLADDFESALILYLPLVDSMDYSPSHKTVIASVSTSSQFPLCFPSHPCFPNPCNNGTCVANDMDVPVCSCLPGYYGSHCETSVSLATACIPGETADGHALFDGSSSVQVSGCDVNSSVGFTVSMFVRRNNLVPGNLFTHSGLQIALSLTAQTLVFGFQADNVSMPLGCEVQQAWVHVAASYNLTTRTMKLYLNEILERQLQRASATVSMGGGAFVVGSAFSGALDDVRFFERELSIAELQAIRANLAPTNNLKFFLPMGSDGANASAIFDASSTDQFPEMMLEIPSVALSRVQTVGNVVLSSSFPLCYPDHSDPCFPNPCANGVCSLKPNATSPHNLYNWLNGVDPPDSTPYRCKCFPGYWGKACEARSTERTCFPGVHANRFYRFGGTGAYAGINGLELSAAFAISFWARTNSSVAGQNVITHGATFAFGFGAGLVKFGFGGVTVSTPLDCQIQTEWHHYTGTATTFNSIYSLKLYVDGKLMATQSIPIWYLNGDNVPIQIGSGFLGGLDDIRISNVGLSDAEVASQYISGAYQNLRMWVSFGTYQNQGVVNEVTGSALAIASPLNGALTDHNVAACLELRVIPGSLVPIQNAMIEPRSGALLVANSSGPAIVSFQMTLTQSSANGLPLPPVSGWVSQASFYAGSFDKRFNCTGFTAQPIRGGGGPIALNCTLPNNSTSIGGAFLQFIVTYCLWPSNTCGSSTPIPWTSPLLLLNKTTFQYPFPTITQRSLQRIEIPLKPAFATWVAKNLIVETFQFSGTNFIADPSIMSVTYGPVSQPDKFLCTLLVSNTTSTRVVFETSDQGYGTDLVFQVNVAGAKVVGTDTYFYPTVPTVTKIEGCNVTLANSTFDCPTVGNLSMTIYGTGFYYENGAFDVFVGDRLCSDPQVPNSSVVFCTLPFGAGLLQNVYVQSLKYFSIYQQLVNFAPPKIVSLYGEGCNNSDPTRVTNCPREGSQSLTVTGSNFGDSLAAVLIGTSSCGSVVHLNTTHTLVTCVIPAGHQLDQPVLLIAYRGEISKDPVTLSYKQCPQGQYEVSDGGDYPCQDCAEGTFAPAEGAVGSCTPCPPGRFSVVNASTICTQCDPGRFQAAPGNTMCTKCNPGTFAGASGQSVCEDCLPGKYQAGLDSQKDCAPCESGKVQVLSGKATCEFCGAGTTNNAEFKQCLQCESGSVAPQVGEPTCLVCPPKSYSSSDSLLCECEVGMYGGFSGNHSFADSFNVICSTCPSGAACTIRPIWSYAIPALPGYWHVTPDALHFEPCLFIQHCPGQVVGGSGNDTGCGANRGGLLCANCLPKFKSTGGAAPCDACPESAGESWGWSMLFVLAIFAALAVVYAIVLRADAEQDRAFNGKEGEVKLSTLPPILSMGDASVLTTSVVLTEENQRTSRFTSTLKILVGFFQISTSLAIFDDVKLPSYYSTFVGWFDVINLDFVPWTSLSCVANFNFFTKTLLTGFIPMAVIGSFTAGFFGWYKIAQARDFSDDPSARKKRKVYRLKFWKLLLFTLFLLYPSVSRSLLRYFVCRSINFESYLLADLTMVCGPGVWLDNLGYALLFVLAYPIGIPAVFFYLMWRRRKKLRRVNTIQTYSFLYQAYIEKVWFFEEVEMVHKLTMTSILQFFPGRMRFQAGMIVTYMYTTTVLLVSPYVQKKNEILAVICEVEIMLLLLAGNAMSAEGQLPVGSFLDVLLSILLILATCGAFFLFIATSIHHARQNYWNKKRLSAEKAASERRKKDAEGNSVDESTTGGSSVTFGDSHESDESDEARASFKPNRRQQEDMQNALQSTFSEQIVPFWIVLQESIENIWDHIRSRPCCEKIMKVVHRVLDPAGAWFIKGWDAFIFACGKLLDACHCATAGATCRRLACSVCCVNRKTGKPKQYTNLMLELMLPEKRIGRSASEFMMRPPSETEDDSSDSGSHSLMAEEPSHSKLFKPKTGDVSVPKKAILKAARVQPVEVEPLPPPPPKKRPADAAAKPLPGPPPRKPKKPEAS